MRFFPFLLLLCMAHCQSNILHSRSNVQNYIKNNPYLGGAFSSSYSHRLDQDAVSIARELIGVPYVYGGKDLNGIDCSGLTSYVYRELGKPIPNGAANQYTAANRKSRPDPGDLLFFNVEGRGIDHVGIYAGNGTMIHAPGTGKHVAEVSLNSYWKPKYAGAGSF